MKSFQQVRPLPHHDAASGAPVQPRRPIGSFLRDTRTLSDDQIERILAHQRQHGVRFGEAAVTLRFADRTDVLEALSRQFQYAPGFVGRQASPELVTATDPFGDQADAFRELRSRLLLEVLDEHQRGALAIVSPDVGDGKSYVCANLAVAFSQLGARTLLLDADIRTPRQAELLGVEHEAGLSSVLAGFADVAGTVQSVPGLPSLYLLPGGPVPPNPLELLQRPAFGVIVRDMLQKFEHVIIDTPAAIRGSDARVIAAQCGAVLVVGRKGLSRMESLEGFVASLARRQTRVAGVVMNDH